MVNILTTKGKKKPQNNSYNKEGGRRLWEELDDVYDLDGGDGFTGMYLPETH